MSLYDKEQEDEVTWWQAIRGVAWKFVFCTPLWTHTHLKHRTEETYTDRVAEFRANAELNRANIKQQITNNQTLKQGLESDLRRTEDARECDKIALQIAFVEKNLEHLHDAETKMIELSGNVSLSVLQDTTSAQQIDLLDRRNDLAENTVIGPHRDKLTEEDRARRQQLMAEQVTRTQMAMQTGADQIDDLTKAREMTMIDHAARAQVDEQTRERVREILAEHHKADPLLKHPRLFNSPPLVPTKAPERDAPIAGMRQREAGHAHDRELDVA